MTEEERIQFLCNQLPEQLGNTDGYNEEFNVHEHEPARSLIAIGPKCLKHLRSHLNDFRPTKAEWRGRSALYTLRVSDVVVCIFRKIGGAEEVALLRRRLEIFHDVTEHLVDYAGKQSKWPREDLAWCFDLLEPARSGRTIMLWAVAEIEKREKPSRENQPDTGTAKPNGEQ